MSNLKPLVMMQLKDKIDFSYLKSVKKTIAKVVLSLLKFSIITGLVFVAFYLISFLRLTDLNPGIPTSVFSMIFGVMVFLSIIVCMFGLTKSLYLAKDNQVLLTMPTSRLMVFVSKMIVYTIYEFIRNLTYILPLLIAYSLVNSMPVWFYLWLLVATLIITLLSVSIGALLSIPALLVSFIFRRHKILQYAIITALVVALVLLAIWLISLIPENIDLLASWGTIFWDIQDFLVTYTQKFAFIYNLAVAFVGVRYGVSNLIFRKAMLSQLLIVCLVIVAVLVVTFLIVRPIFFKMASKPFEYAKKSGIKEKKNRRNTAFLGSLKKEFLITFRTNEKLTNIILTIVLLPILILLMNKIFNAMDTRLSGAYMAMTFNVLMILLIALSSNAVVSKLYSQEGLSSFVNKTVPAKTTTVLVSKLTIFLVLFNLSIMVATIIFGVFNNYGAGDIIKAIIALCAIYSGHLFSSATLDIMNPQTAQYATTGTHINNPNELKSTLSAFGLSAVIALIFFFLVDERPEIVWTKIMLIGLVYFGWKLYMYLTKIKVYFKEK